MDGWIDEWMDGWMNDEWMDGNKEIGGGERGGRENKKDQTFISAQ